MKNYISFIEKSVEDENDIPQRMNTENDEENHLFIPSSKEALRINLKTILERSHYSTERIKELEDNFENKCLQYPEGFNFSESLKCILNEKLCFFEGEEFEEKQICKRLINCLNRCGIQTVADIIAFDLASNNGNEWVKIRNFGRKSLF